MDFGGLLVLGALWLLFNLLGRGRANPRTTPRGAPPVPLPRSSSDSLRTPSVGDPTQREGGRLERLLRELERNLEQAGARAGDDERVEERESPEHARVISLETEVVRPERVSFSQDTDAEALVQRRISAAERQSSARTKASRKKVVAQIRQEPADHTAVRRFTRVQLRNAIVWREILGPPVSERDPHA